MARREECGSAGGWERGLRSKPVERPRPLRRGEGIGGGITRGQGPCPRTRPPSAYTSAGAAGGARPRTAVCPPKPGETRPGVARQAARPTSGPRPGARPGTPRAPPGRDTACPPKPCPPKPCPPKPCPPKPCAKPEPKPAVQGPRLYPIFPGQYEEPLRRLPGPTTVVLRPGDVDPQETTVIDILGLEEGDPCPVPGMPPPGPTSLPNPFQDFEQQEQMHDESCGVRKRRRPPSQIPDLSHLNLIYSGRAFPGNWEVQDPMNPPFCGPPHLRPQQQATRARPFSGRKTVCHMTDEDRAEVEESRKRIRERCEREARERERATRGLGQDDLMDPDCSPPPDQSKRGCRSPVRDPWDTPPNCRNSPANQIWANQYLPSSPPRMDPGQTKTPPRVPPRPPPDLLTTSPCPESSPRPHYDDCLISPDEPQVDLLGLYPPRQQPRPPPPRDPGDLLGWDDCQPPLPYDFDGQDPSLADRMYRTSPHRTLPSPQRYQGQGQGQSLPPGGQMMVCTPLNPPPPNRSPRAPKPRCRQVEAVALREDPLTAMIPCETPRRPCAPRPSPVWSTSPQDYLGSRPQDNRYMFNEEDFHMPVRSPGACRSPGQDSSFGLLEQEDVDQLYSPTRSARERPLRRIAQECDELLEDEPAPYPAEMFVMEREAELEPLVDFRSPRSSPRSSWPRRSPATLGQELAQVDMSVPCDDIANLFIPREFTSRPSPRMGPMGRELLCEFREEDTMVELGEECPQEAPQYYQRQGGYTRDLMSNVEWRPDMRRRLDDMYGACNNR